MKHQQAGSITREDRESIYHICGGPVLLAKVCLCAGKTDKGVLIAEEVLLSMCRPV